MLKFYLSSGYCPHGCPLRLIFNQMLGTFQFFHQTVQTIGNNFKQNTSHLFKAQSLSFYRLNKSLTFVVYLILHVIRINVCIANAAGAE